VHRVQPRRQRTQARRERHEHAIAQAPEVGVSMALAGEVQHDQAVAAHRLEGMHGTGRDHRDVMRIDATTSAIDLHLQHPTRGHHDLHEVVVMERRR
jgi:hypothetical protein